MHNLGAFHGAEVPYVFYDSFELVGAERELSATMATFYTNFAATGDPNTKPTEETAERRRRLQHHWGPPPPPPPAQKCK